MKYLFSLCCFLGLTQFASAQNEQAVYDSKSFKIPQSAKVIPATIPLDFNAQIIHREAPSPDGDNMKAYLMHLKTLSRKQFPVKKNSGPAMKMALADSPTLGIEFGQFRKHPVTGDLIQMNGGRPNDNALAVSNDGIVVTAMNSFVYAYDLNTNETALENARISLTSMAGASSQDQNHYFDPKLIYDEEADRFILVFLKNTSPSNNKIVIAFSTSNNPDDAWNIYEIPGNPLDNNRWTDFPAISLTGEDLFISGNLIVPDEPWQVGFDGSIVWQIEKATGYSDTEDLNTKLYSNITYDNKYIRNLHVVRGADGIADKQYLLSNRNFDISNDTIFVMDITGNLSDGNPSLAINLGISDLPYGVPPNARQEDTDLDDPTGGLQTNDARVLAAIKIDNQIQFVSNSVNPATGLCAIYHGKITNLDEPEITANLIADTDLDFGYPNIAWTGDEDCDIETIIAFNHTSPTVFPGISCIYHNNEGEYSNVVRLKEGLGYVDRISDANGYERWGDYFGLQRKYNEGYKVYSFGYFGTEKNSNTGWTNEIISPSIADSSIVHCDYSAMVYPNPTQAEASVRFSMSKKAEITATIYDMTGNRVGILLNQVAKKGHNELVFSVGPLKNGQYIIKIDADGTEILSEKIVKH